MGYLTDFVKEKMTKEHDEKLMQLDAWKGIISDPAARPEAVEWATTNMLGMHPETKKQTEQVLPIIKLLHGIQGGAKKVGGAVGGALGMGGAGGGGEKQASAPTPTPTPQASSAQASAPTPTPTPSDPFGKAMLPAQQSTPVPLRYTPEELAGQAGRVTDITNRAATPSLIDRARETGKVNQEFAAPITKELADGSIVQWDPTALRPDGRKGDWIQATSQDPNSQGGPGLPGTPTSTPMRGPTKPPSILNGKDGAPIGISRPTGQVITDPGSMLPDEKALFTAATDMFQADLARDEAKLLAAEERFNKAQAAMEDRFQRGQESIISRSNRTYDFQTANALRDDYRSQVNQQQAGYPAKMAAYQNINALRSRLLSNQEARTGPDDIALLYNFIRMNDPNRVTEGELDLVRRGQTTPENIYQAFQQITGLDARLMSQPLRQSMLRTADNLFNSSIVPQIEAVNEQFRTNAQQMGIPESALMLIDPKRGLGTDGPGAGGAGNKRVTINGKNYEVDANGTIIRLVPAGAGAR